MATLMKDWAPYLIAVAVALFWLWSHDAGVRATALADLRADSLTRELAALDSVDGLRAVERLGQEARISGLVDSLASSRQTIRALRIRGVEATAALHTHLDQDSSASDSLRTLVNTTITILEDSHAACEAALMGCVSIQAIQRAVILTLDSTVTERQAALDRLNQLWIVERQRARPGLLRRAEMSLPFVATAVLLTLVLTR